MSWQQSSPPWHDGGVDGGGKELSGQAAQAPSIQCDESKSEGNSGVQVPSIPSLVGSRAAAVANPHKRRVYGPPRVSEAHKRERNRVTFKRFYHRKQQTLRELRQEEEALTEQCQQLLANQPASSEIDPQQPREAAYVALVAHKDRLQAEHTALLQATEKDVSTRRLLGRLVDTLVTGLDGQPSTEYSQIDIPRRIAISRDYAHATQRAIQELSRIQAEGASIQDQTTTTDAFGWHYRYQPCGQSIEFAFTKTFTNICHLSPQELATKTRKFCTQASGHDHNASPSSLVRTRRHIVEEMDEGRRCLVYRCQSPERHQRHQHATQPNNLLLLAKSMYRVSVLRLVQPSQGFVVVSHSVETPENWCVDDGSDLLVHPSDWYDLGVLLGAAPWEIRDKWVDELNWWRIEQDPHDPSSVEVTFSGRAALCLELQSDAWFMELLRLVVQWEHAVVGAAPISCHHQR